MRTVSLEFAKTVIQILSALIAAVAAIGALTVYRALSVFSFDEARRSNPTVFLPAAYRHL
jgi:hypothetical protein